MMHMLVLQTLPPWRIVAVATPFGKVLPFISLPLCTDISLISSIPSLFLESCLHPSLHSRPMSDIALVVTGVRLAFVISEIDASRREGTSSYRMTEQSPSSVIGLPHISTFLFRFIKSNTRPERYFVEDIAMSTLW